MPRPFQPTNTGYDTNALKQPAPYGANGWLRSMLGDGSEVPMWVYEVQTGFAMSGSTGQSYRTRSFFPHNMEQTRFTIMAQFPNQELYADAVEFIRAFQVKFTSSMLLQVVGRSTYRGRRLKGKHDDIACEGYVLSVKREHRQHEYAPLLQFDFIAERIYKPTAWADETVKMKMLTTWKEVIEMKKPGFIPNDDLPAGQDQIPTRPGIAPDGQGGFRPN